MVLQERRKLRQALTPAFLENDPPQWTKLELIRVMKKLSNSQKGFVMYNSLCEEFGKTR